MDCPEALNEIGALIDGELPTAERAALEAHLSGCGDCRDVYQRLRVCDAQLLRAITGSHDVGLNFLIGIGSYTLPNSPSIF